MSSAIPCWVLSILTSPGGRSRLKLNGNKLTDLKGRHVAYIDKGVIHFTSQVDDASVAYYRSIGGAHFHERAAAPYSMSALDTPVYHAYLRQIAPKNRSAVIVDVGAGDGRNSLPWLQWGYKRLVVIDGVAAALYRFRDLVAAWNEAWLNNIVLIECNVRSLPLASACADRVVAIEALYYLNDEYGTGLRECRRIMRPSARLLVSERDHEGALLTRLLYYGGLEAFVEMGQSRQMWDGEAGNLVRTRCFTQPELLALLRRQGLRALEAHGVSLFSLILSFFSKSDGFSANQAALRESVCELLETLGRNGTARRCHVVIAALDRAERTGPGKPGRARRH
jgi:SAM-dependent methyltransferase